MAAIRKIARARLTTLRVRRLTACHIPRVVSERISSPPNSGAIRRSLTQWFHLRGLLPETVTSPLFARQSAEWRPKLRLNSVRHPSSSPSKLPSIPAMEIHRRRFLRRVGLGSAVLAANRFPLVRAAAPRALGHGHFRYRQVPGWGQLTDQTPVKNCSALALTRDGHLLLFNDHTANNVIVYDQAGRLVHKWGTSYPGAHGMSLVEEAGREVLYLTDLQRHRVFKTTLDGTVLNEWGCPPNSGQYKTEEEYRPSWTLHRPGGGFFALDGYGKDYIASYTPEGRFQRLFGGPEGGIAQWGPHGGLIEPDPKTRETTLLLAMSDQQYLLRLDLQGRHLAQINLPGGNPRQIHRHAGHYFIPHLGDNWPKDKQCRGFVSILDARLRLVSNLAGNAPEYDPAGRLRPMRHQEDIFQHPHDLAVDSSGSIYVAEFDSGQTYPLKFERV